MLSQSWTAWRNGLVRDNGWPEFDSGDLLSDDSLVFTLTMKAGERNFISSWFFYYWNIFLGSFEE